RDVLGGRAVGVGVGLDPVGRVGVGAPIAPVHDVARDRVGAGIGDRAEGQRVGAALVDVGRTRDRDRRLDVVHRDRQGVGPVQMGAVLVDEVHRDVLGGRAVGVGVGLDPVGGVGVGAPIAPVHDVARDRVGAGIGDR